VAFPNTNQQLCHPQSLPQTVIPPFLFTILLLLHHGFQPLSLANVKPFFWMLSTIGAEESGESEELRKSGL
jgi:hypothetical protein